MTQVTEKPLPGTWSGAQQIAKFNEVLDQIFSGSAAAARSTLALPGFIYSANSGSDYIRRFYDGAGDHPVWRWYQAANEILIEQAVLGFRSVGVSATTTLGAEASAQLYLVDATSGNITITLPSVASAAKLAPISFLRVDATANTVTIDGNAAETIEGAATVPLRIGEATELRTNGSSWYQTVRAPAERMGSPDLTGLSVVARFDCTDATPGNFTSSTRISEGVSGTRNGEGVYAFLFDTARANADYRVLVSEYGSAAANVYAKPRNLATTGFDINSRNLAANVAADLAGLYFTVVEEIA